MSSEVKDPVNARCLSEYAELKRVVLCPPRYMEIKEVINDIQKEYAKENIDVEYAMEQHANFVKALNAHGVETILLEPSKQFPEQVFTRDIGFIIDDQVFISEMASTVRQGEERELQNWLAANNIPFHTISGTNAEGGDVMIDGNTVFIGISSRTSSAAARHLKAYLPNYEIIEIPLSHKYLHLDCVFNILSPQEALIFPEALSTESINLLAERYQLIHVEAAEQFTLGTNVLSIGNKHVFSLPQNKQVNQKLREYGFSVIEVDLSEIIKSGGSFRCCTMPIFRA